MTTDSSSTEIDPPMQPTVYPTFIIPGRIADLAGGILVSAAALLMIGGLVLALTVSSPSPSRVGRRGPGVSTDIVQVGQWSYGFADRLSLFVSNGASVPVALLLVFGLLVVAMATRYAGSGDEELGRPRALMLGTGVTAAVVVAANVVSRSP